MKQRLFVDMDGTLAKFHDQAKYIERMFEKDFFRNLEPFENMVEGIRQFIQNHPDVEVYTVSARINGEPPYCEEEKNAWLDEHLPEIDQAHRIYTEVGKPKAEYIPGGVRESDFLLDDYNKGLNQWLYDGGSAIKCHNNINQHGLGIYGGSAGMLWTGDMVHTEDSPELISAELAHHMGRAYFLDPVLAVNNIGYSKYNSSSTLHPSTPPHKRDTSLYLEKDLSVTNSYKATNTKSRSSEQFKNPLNAVRWLQGREEFKEVPMQLPDGSKFSIPAFQADAIFSNLYGIQLSGFHVHDLAQDQISADVAAEFESALEESKMPVVGRVNYLGSNGKVGETAVFHSAEEMEKEIEECQDCGCPIRAEWFVQPKDKEIILETYPELNPNTFKLSSENLRLAADYCDLEFQSVDVFLSTYTWDDSEMIWNNYAKYVDGIAEVMTGFASRQEVEREFHENMCEPGATPAGVAGTILANIMEWARWDNADAFRAGIDVKAAELCKSLGLGSDSSNFAAKASLDDMISEARKQQGSGDNHPPEPTPER